MLQAMATRTSFGSNVRSRLSSVVTIATFALAAGIGSAAPEAICRPGIEFHPLRPISGEFPQERLWKADLTGDASQCREQSGLFQLQITRLKENAPDLDFLVIEVWRAGQFEVQLTLANDEAIGLSQIIWIARCSCTPRIIVSGQK
jgi:hypothetical protein